MEVDDAVVTANAIAHNIDWNRVVVDFPDCIDIDVSAFDVVGVDAANILFVCETCSCRF